MALIVFYSLLMTFFSVVIQIVIWNRKVTHNYGIYEISIISGCVALLFFLIFMVTPLSPEDIYLIYSLFSLLIMVHLHLYVGITRSVSIRLLGELSVLPGKQMAITEMEEKYPFVFMFEHRLKTLVEHKWLKFVGGKYSCTRKGVLIAKCHIFLSKIYNIQFVG